MGDTKGKNIDSITITTTFRTKYRSIDYSNDYLLRNSSNMLVISYKYFYTIKNNSITLRCLQKLSSRNNSTPHFVKKAADLICCSCIFSHIVQCFFLLLFSRHFRLKPREYKIKTGIIEVLILTKWREQTNTQLTHLQNVQIFILNIDEK
jgi:hypothetical protein